jgi:hypothetical protein
LNVLGKPKPRVSGLALDSTAFWPLALCSISRQFKVFMVNVPFRLSVGSEGVKYRDVKAITTSLPCGRLSGVIDQPILHLIRQIVELASQRSLKHNFTASVIPRLL